jgi:hypothetical protein
VPRRACSITDAEHDGCALQVTGRSLRVVHGPRTDRAGWTAMLASAAAGGVSRGQLWTCTSTCEEIEVRSQSF